MQRKRWFWREMFTLLKIDLEELNTMKGMAQNNSTSVTILKRCHRLAQSIKNSFRNKTLLSVKVLGFVRMNFQSCPEITSSHFFIVKKVT
mmetsp:Transcript_17490/g.25710  ORF Transcript_17490/g.25710 Transcript_17490/m.25710 type:complete len:90 (+) Transcript_17490:125-394(+)